MTRGFVIAALSGSSCRRHQRHLSQPTGRFLMPSGHGHGEGGVSSGMRRRPIDVTRKLPLIRSQKELALDDDTKVAAEVRPSATLRAAPFLSRQTRPATVARREKNHQPKSAPVEGFGLRATGRVPALFSWLHFPWQHSHAARDAPCSACTLLLVLSRAARPLRGSPRPRDGSLLSCDGAQWERTGEGRRRGGRKPLPG